jgi:CO/xanthine dehydrogenase Mo-binding subunit
VGEPPIIPTAPAIANAIADALGIRFKELPITRDKILEALGKK